MSELTNKVLKRMKRHFDIKRVLGLVAALFFCVLGAKGQISNDGLYYIKINDVNNNVTTTVYLWRAITEKTPGQPYLSGWTATTFNDGSYDFDAAHCTWIVKQVTYNNNTYYTLMNVATGQYVVWDHYDNGGNTGKAVHLETLTSAPDISNNNDKRFYTFYLESSKYYIHPKPCTANKRGFNYKGGFNATDLLRERVGSPARGLIQFYDNTSCSIVSAPVVAAPIASMVSSGHYTITTAPNSINSALIGDGTNGTYKVLYTLDGSDPITNGTPYNPADGISITENCTLKAVVVGYDIVLTQMLEKDLIVQMQDLKLLLLLLN